VANAIALVIIVIVQVGESLKQLCDEQVEFITNGLGSLLIC
jgi:hypothetical protein